MFASSLLATGCADDFSPYNFIEGFRVIAVSSSEPALEPEATTVLEPLIAFGTDTTTVTYAWSWCPISTGSLGGYECAVTEEEANMLFPGGIGSFDLGTTSSIAFTNPIDTVTGQLIVDLCESTDPEIPQAVKDLGCAGRLPVTFRVEATDDNETISTIKEVDILLTPDAERNTNPVMTGLRANGAGLEDVPIALDGSTEFVRGQEYEIEIEIDIDQSESFEFTPPDTMMTETRREALTFTWFINAGETDASRTKFIEGEVEFDEAVKNLWTVPREADYPGDTATLVIVVRDGRKGITWIQRSVRIRG